MNNAAVLIVDDDASGRAMLGLSLRQAGYRVFTAASGEEALEILFREKCVCMITDCKMHPIDGFLLSTQAKKLYPNLHIAMMSSACSEKEIQSRPIEEFFAKPVAIDRVVDWLSIAANSGPAI